MSRQAHCREHLTTVEPKPTDDGIAGVTHDLNVQKTGDVLGYYANRQPCSAATTDRGVRSSGRSHRLARMPFQRFHARPQNAIPDIRLDRV